MAIVLLTEEERLGSTVAGRYHLESVLGSGGMAVVYRATHTWTGRGVAVKFLDPRKVKDITVASRRFLKEGRVIGALQHPHVVKVLDMGKDEHGIVFQVLELLHGHTLADRLDQDGRLTAQETLDALFPIMDALTAAHEMDIVHRDLKPENIFISSDESGATVPKLLDFGIAKGLDDQADGKLTREGSILGTPYYMAPEQARGASAVGPQADVFSLGTVFYECLVGDLPFGDLDATAYTLELLSETVASIRDRGASIDEGIAAAVDGALRKDRSERYSSMLDFRRALSSAAKNAALGVPTPAVFTPKARATLLAMREDDSSETLGDDAMLSDLLSGSVPPDPRRNRRVIGMAIAAVVTGVLTFAMVGGGADDPAPGPPNPVGFSPSATSSEAEKVAPPDEELEAGDVEPQGTPETPETPEAEEPVIRRLAVKRTTFPRSLMRPRMSEEGASEDPQDAAITEETSESGMRRIQPNVVREF